jgi:GNAT superfamily N-acetyltransferase
MALTWMQTECLPEDDPLDPETGVWWLAIDDGVPVAFASVHPSQQWLDTVYLSRAGVLPQARGNGLQRRLIQARLRYARARGYRHAVSDTSQNPVSANNLIRSGFRMFSPSQPWGLPTSLYWTRKL